MIIVYVFIFQVAHIKLESDGGSSPHEDIPPPPLSAPPMLRPPHPLCVQFPGVASGPTSAELSWDSESQVSQTSSTSGYRYYY